MREGRGLSQLINWTRNGRPKKWQLWANNDNLVTSLPNVHARSLSYKLVNLFLENKKRNETNFDCTRTKERSTRMLCGAWEMLELFELILHFESRFNCVDCWNEWLHPFHISSSCRIRRWREEEEGEKVSFLFKVAHANASAVLACTKTMDPISQPVWREQTSEWNDKFQSRKSSS